jgi:prevent-host-death family protein
MYKIYVHKMANMSNSTTQSRSVAQSRQQLSSLIEAAQTEPQVITKHNTPIAVLVSADYFNRSEVAAKAGPESFYAQLMQLRQANPPRDNNGLGIAKSRRKEVWSRANEFSKSD